MMHFKDVEEDGEQYLCVTANSNVKAKDDDHKFLICRSMLRPGLEWDPIAMRKLVPESIVAHPTDVPQSGPIYILKSSLPDFETDLQVDKPFLLGRKIIDGHVQWGHNSLKVYGEASHIPLYWEWTEDILCHYSKRLTGVGIYDAICASLYTYDRNSDVIRAFCESWCPLTNTLHTLTGEWSISLYDLQVIGGLPTHGCLYDETIPSYDLMSSEDENGVRFLSRACNKLFSAYCSLADQLSTPTGVCATQWIEFWCKQEEQYCTSISGKAGRSKTMPSHSKHIPEQLRVWKKAELEPFSTLGIEIKTPMETTYLAAFLSC